MVSKHRGLRYSIVFHILCAARPKYENVTMTDRECGETIILLLYGRPTNASNFVETIWRYGPTKIAPTFQTGDARTRML